MSETNEATLRAAIAAFNDPERRERYLDLYDPAVVLHGYPRGLEGREGAKRFYTRVWEGFPDARLGSSGSPSQGAHYFAKLRGNGAIPQLSVRAREREPLGRRVEPVRHQRPLSVLLFPARQRS